MAPESTRGFVLLAVLVVTVMAAMVAVGLLYRMQAERSAGAAMLQGEQAYAAAMSGIHTALAVLTTPRSGPPEPVAEGETQPIFIADQSEWHDNPQVFRHRFVAFDGANRWYFTVYAPNDTELEKIRYGLSDESGKLVINAATAEQLDKLGLTPQQRDALLDYKDTDSELRENGAEQEYYDQLEPPYAINHPFGTVEELLLVKGFSGRQVYGEDSNFSGLLEPNEDDGLPIFPPDDNDGKLARGLIDVFTLDTYKQGPTPDLDPLGLPKRMFNQATPEQLEEIGLDPSTIDTIQQLKQANANAGPLDLLKNPAFNVPTDQLHLVMSYLSDRGFNPVGLINLNTAPAAVLATLPGIEPGLAADIVASRADLSPDERTSTVWLLSRGLLDVEQFIAVAPQLKTSGYQFRVRCVGYGVPSGRYRVLEAVIDAQPMDPATVRVLSLRDITRLGAPFPLDAESESE